MTASWWADLSIMRADNRTRHALGSVILLRCQETKFVSPMDRNKRVFSSRPDPLQDTADRPCSWRYFSAVEGRDPRKRYGPWLLGIDHCNIFSRERVRDQTLGDRPVNEIWYVQSNTGMIGVVPAWRLTEMFTLPDMIAFLEWIKKDIDAEQVRPADIATGQRDEK